MLDNDFLSKTLEDGNLSNEDKVKLILAEHDADTRGLKNKNTELLGKEKDLKEKVKSFETEKETFNSTISDLEQKLKANGSEQITAMYEDKISTLNARHQKELEESIAKYDGLNSKYLEGLKKNSIEQGVKNLAFVDGLEKGFIARVMAENNFTAKEIDGQTSFYSDDNKTIEECINAFALSPEGKSYLKNPSNGGGANGGNINNNNNRISRSEFDTYTPAQQSEYCKNGGIITD